MTLAVLSYRPDAGSHKTAGLSRAEPNTKVNDTRDAIVTPSGCVQPLVSITPHQIMSLAARHCRHGYSRIVVSVVVAGTRTKIVIAIGATIIASCASAKLFNIERATCHGTTCSRSSLCLTSVALLLDVVQNAKRHNT